MKLAPSSFVNMLLPLAVLLGGCASDADDGRAAESALSTSNCSFIPGCKHLVEGRDGPFWADVMTAESGAGGERQTLSLAYGGGSLDFCSQVPARRKLRVLFVTGPEHARVSVERAMSISCPSEWGDNPGSQDRATFSLAREEDPALWDSLFPPQPDGARWYALQVAAFNDLGEWDSRYGENYRLVLTPRR